jgi:tetratricopeptide (TPR) repeat protein
MRRLLLIVLAIVLCVPAAVYATCGGGGGGGMGGMMPMQPSDPQRSSARPDAYYVPWKVLKADDPPLTTPVTILWFTSSANDARGGDLSVSRILTIASSQCVGLQLVPADDAATIAKYDVAGKLPVALLVSDGKVVARTDNDKGTLHAYQVENMLNHELFLRTSALDAQLDEAKKKADANDKEGAIAAYQKVWDQHCIAPNEGRQAQKALRKLGVKVSDNNLRASDPDLSPAMNAKMTDAMSRAFAAELAEDYAKARELYRAAVAIDPADPVPVRFLGELYRHHTGEWKFAMETFEQLLKMQPDPLSRAVALHGIGKMTIHMGDSAKGLAYFQQSIAAYPLALTYRNLAVYWNSERRRDIADQYVQKALALDPREPFNLIFAATYLADSGRKDEALKIAKDNENMLAASYNLAAIYALLGNKGKAMELLRRHFYTYERYDAVRAKEMWEARVDYVFASLKDDPEFVKLTAMAE